MVVFKSQRGGIQEALLEKGRSSISGAYTTRVLSGKLLSFYLGGPANGEQMRNKAGRGLTAVFIGMLTDDKFVLPFIEMS